MKRYLCEKLCRARLAVKQESYTKFGDVELNRLKLEVAEEDVSNYFNRQREIASAIFVSDLLRGERKEKDAAERAVALADILLSALHKDHYMSILEAADSVTDDPDLMHETTKTEAEITDYIHFDEEAGRDN